MKIALLLFAMLFIFSCAHITDHNSLGSSAIEPKANNNYTGELIVYAFEGKGLTMEDLKQKARLNCNYLGGIRTEPYIYMSIPFADGVEGFYKYQCNGPQPVNYAPAPIANPNQAPTKSSVSIDQAKQQCKDLGFKAGTEKFGNCVLELNK